MYQLETLWAKNQTIVKKNIKLILKFGWKIPNFNLGAKILNGVDRLWDKLQLVYGTYSLRAFPLRDEDSIAGVFASIMFAPTGVYPKGGRLHSIFLHPN